MVVNWRSIVFMGSAARYRYLNARCVPCPGNKKAGPEEPANTYRMGRSFPPNNIPTQSSDYRFVSGRAVSRTNSTLCDHSDNRGALLFDLIRAQEGGLAWDADHGPGTQFFLDAAQF